MLDGLHKSRTDIVWQAIARPLAATGITPNQVTWLGLVLVVTNCAAYIVHQNSVWFGVGLALSFAFDALDGAVARLQGRTSKFGGYLDAVVDRYQELAAYFAIAWVNDWWMVSFLAITGSFLVSYNKARTAIEIPIQNHNWPDLLERFERIVIICGALILDPFVPLPDFLGGRVLYLGVAVIAVGSHVTAVQRFYRARSLLLK